MKKQSKFVLALAGLVLGLLLSVALSAQPRYTNDSDTPTSTRYTDKFNEADQVFAKAVIYTDTYPWVGVVEVPVQAAEEVLFSKVIDIDSATLKTSFTTEVVLVPSPGAAYLIVPVAVTTELKFVEVFADNSGVSQISYAGSSTSLVGLSTILASAANTLRSDGITGAAIATTASRGKALVYKHTTANPSGGKSTLRIRVLYRLIPNY